MVIHTGPCSYEKSQRGNEKNQKAYTMKKKNKYSADQKILLPKQNLKTKEQHTNSRRLNREKKIQITLFPIRPVIWKRNPTKWTWGSDLYIRHWVCDTAMAANHRLHEREHNQFINHSLRNNMPSELPYQDAGQLLINQRLIPLLIRNIITAFTDFPLPSLSLSASSKSKNNSSSRSNELVLSRLFHLIIDSNFL